MAFPKSGILKKWHFPKSSSPALRFPTAPWGLWKRWHDRLSGDVPQHELSLSLLSPFHMGLFPLQQPGEMGAVSS